MPKRKRDEPAAYVSVGGITFEISELSELTEVADVPTPLRIAATAASETTSQHEPEARSTPLAGPKRGGRGSHTS